MFKIENRVRKMSQLIGTLLWRVIETWSEGYWNMAEALMVTVTGAFRVSFVVEVFFYCHDQTETEDAYLDQG